MASFERRSKFDFNIKCSLRFFPFPFMSVFKVGIVMDYVVTGVCSQFIASYQEEFE